MKRLFRNVLLLCAAIFISFSAGAAPKNPPAKNELVFVASKNKGIYSGRFDLETRTISSFGIAATGLKNSSFLAADPAGRFLYVAGEGNVGAVTAFAIGRTNGHLYLLNTQSSRGAGPAHLAVDHAGKNVLVANYGSGSIAVLPIQKDGSLGAASAFVQHKGSSINPQRQAGPHAHFITTDPADHFAFVCDLGLDHVVTYKFNSAKGSLTPNDPPFASLKPGAGPRHLAFHPSGRWAYVINELDSTTTAFFYNAEHGAMSQLQNISTLPKDFSGKNFPAEIAAHPSGKFIYGSNRGDDSIVVYEVDPKTGKLALVEIHPTGGKVPRNFEVDPTGKFLLAANQDSGNVIVYRIDPATGKLSPTETTIEVDMPFCVKNILLED